MYALLSGHNLPIPEVLATYRSIRPNSKPSLRSAKELEDYIRSPGHLPVYLKRSFGSYGRGNAMIQSMDGDNVILGNGTRESVSEFCRTIDEGRSLGWILQPSLTSHTTIRDLTQSDKISGLRIHTFLSRKGAQVIKAIFKINMGARDSDNFEHGASGNMLGAVDITSGKVVRVVSGTGLNQVDDPLHPLTGAEIVGFQIPDWEKVLTLVHDAQAAFPGFICPGWDIALCDDGPKILEVNAFGDIDLFQHAHRSSFLDEQFIFLMKERGLEELLYSNPRKSKQSPVNQRLGVRRHHWQW